MRIGDFIDFVESTAVDGLPLVFIDGDRAGYGAVCKCVSGDITVKGSPFKRRIIISLQPKDDGIPLEREPFLSFLRSLMREYSPKHRIVLRLYEYDHNLTCPNGKPMLSEFELAFGELPDYQDMLTDDMWGHVTFKGENYYQLSNGGGKWVAAPEVWEERARQGAVASY